MTSRSRNLVIGALAGVGVVAILAVATWLVVAYTGAYNIAAIDRHADIVRWTFDTTMHNSVRSRADDIPEPEAVSPEAVSSGAQTYASTCSHCHGAPGSDRPHWATNMRPQPPDLTEAATEWERREIFWIVKNGIKMTGMPAFGPEHDDATIWGIATFVDQLPGMTPEEYSRVSGDGNHGGQSHQSH